MTRHAAWKDAISSNEINRPHAGSILEKLNKKIRSILWSYKICYPAHIHRPISLCPELQESNPLFHTISLSSILMSSSHPRLGHPSCFFLEGFLTKPYIYCWPMCAACLAPLIRPVGYMTTRLWYPWNVTSSTLTSSFLHLAATSTVTNLVITQFSPANKIFNEFKRRWCRVIIVVIYIHLKPRPEQIYAERTNKIFKGIRERSLLKTFRLPVMQRSLWNSLTLDWSQRRL
jgi:hypothetical protein